MPDQVNPSFIPKQNPAQLTRRNPSRQVFVLAILSYTLIVAALLAAGGLYAYERYVNKSLAKEIESYNTEIASFNTEEFQNVVALSEQLTQAKKLLDGRVAMATVLDIIASSTIDTVQFTDAKLERLLNGDVSFEASAKTDSFDSILFQRRIYDEAAKIATVDLSDVDISFGSEAGEEEGSDTGETEVTFSAVFSLKKDDLPVKAGEVIPPVVPRPSQAVPTSSPASSTASSTAS